MQQIIFIADLIACPTCFGHHYAHLQELESIIQVAKPDTLPSAPHHTDNLKTKAPNTTGSNNLYNTLELLMMGIVVPETCSASKKICNKNHLLHLVGILFPHIKDDAWSKSHQICKIKILCCVPTHTSHVYILGLVISSAKTFIFARKG